MYGKVTCDVLTCTLHTYGQVSGRAEEEVDERGEERDVETVDGRQTTQ